MSAIRKGIWAQNRMAGSTQQTGQLAEQLAADHLQRSGYTIIARNWRCPVGEIDIIAQAHDALVFVEVRSRRTPTTEAAFESITPRKRDRMIKSAHYYMNTHNIPEAVFPRIDVIAVALPRAGAPVIEHVENALDW